MTYKPDNTLRRKSDQLVTQNKIPSKLLRLSMDPNVDNHIEQAKKMDEERMVTRSSKASLVAVDQEEEQEILESDDDSDMPFDKADIVEDD